MTLKDIREKTIKEYITKNLLDESIYPTLEKVCAILIKDYGDSNVNSSLILDKHFVDINEPASASKINDIISRSKLDIDTVYNFIDYLEQQILLSSRIIERKISSLTRKASILEQKAKSLLISNEDVNQNINVIDESFINSENINLNNTNVNIDYGNGYIYSKYDKSNTNNYLDVKSIFSTVLTKGYTFYRPYGGHGIEKAYDKSNIAWIQRVGMPASYNKNVEVSLKIELNKKYQSSRLFIDLGNTIRYKIKVVARKDGQFITVSDYAYYTGYADINFSPVEIDYIVINISTSQHFSIGKTGKEYRVSIKEIYIGNPSFAKISSLESNQHTVSPFSTIGLYTEQYTPTNTNISYMVSWENNEWHNIEPYNIGNIDFNKYISVLTEYGQTKEDITIDFTKRHPYIYDTNLTTSYTESSINYLGILNPKILRNLGGFSINEDKESIFETNLYITQTTKLNCYKYPAYINGSKTEESIDLEPGFYAFKFNTSNNFEAYKEYLDSLTSSTFYYGSHIAVYKPQEIFINIAENNNYNIFTFLDINSEYVATLKSLGTEVISDSTYDKESMLVIKNDINQATIDGLPTTIKLKAILESDEHSTPILYGYKIKLG